MRWKVEYDNDTGPNDEGFCEWWIVTNGDLSFKCSDDISANWLRDVLNAYQPVEP